MEGGVRPVLERELDASFFLPEFYHETVNISDILNPEYMINFFKKSLPKDTSLQVKIDKILNPYEEESKYNKEYTITVDPKLREWRNEKDYDFVIFKNNKDQIVLIASGRPIIYDNSIDGDYMKYWAVRDGDNYHYVLMPGHSAIKWPDEDISTKYDDMIEFMDEPRTTIDDDVVFYAGNIKFNDDGTLNEVVNDSGHYIPLPINEDTLVNDYYTSKYPGLLSKVSTFSRMGGSKRRPKRRKTQKQTKKRKTTKKKKKTRKKKKRSTKRKRR